jgi:hypothetical protein
VGGELVRQISVPSLLPRIRVQGLPKGTTLVGGSLGELRYTGVARSATRQGQPAIAEPLLPPAAIGCCATTPR